MSDNDDALISATTFETESLATILKELSRQDIEQMMNSTCRVFSERFDEASFLVRLVHAMPDGLLAGRITRPGTQPIRCVLQRPGPILHMARAGTRAFWPRGKPRWVLRIAPVVSAIDRRLLRLAVLMLSPSCCREAAKRRQHAPCMLGN